MILGRHGRLSPAFLKSCITPVVRHRPIGEIQARINFDVYLTGMPLSRSSFVLAASQSSTWAHRETV